ncbi:efflux RND transporter periplasmic adaptor subunit [Marisediminicola senii]|uniref:hypothetical protein n=1 Tax=Marisediminicola senii TaxID=2711233 RepID=UPI0019112B49|nr:hypothetical protein [Marisediminicola senii]
MGIVRTWIFPIIRLLIFAAIAAALVKLAFFGETTQAASPEFPTAEIVEPEVPVVIGTIQNDVTVTGSVAQDAAVPVKATMAGDVVRVIAAVGATVAADTPVATIRSTTPGAIAADGTVAPDVVKTVTVVAGSPGILSSVSVIAAQTVTVGEAIAQVAPTTFSVSGALAPEQQYRLITRPSEATVSITGGPAPFTCTGLTISSALPGATSVSGAGDGAEPAPATGATVRCAVPAEVTVFAGLAAELTMAGGVAENVLTVPVTAVEGSAGTGNVYVLADDGSSEPKPVTLGLTDGTSVEITGGLAENEMVMQYVPGAPQQGVDMGDGCMSFPDGSITCEG